MYSVHKLNVSDMYSVLKLNVSGMYSVHKLNVQIKRVGSVWVYECMFVLKPINEYAQ